MTRAAQVASSPRAAALSARGVAALAGAAFALRVLVGLALDTPGLAAPGDAWAWGAESVCLARSLLEQGVYADPWCQGTGPSAWLTPPYPALLAGLMAIFGGVSRATAVALLVVQAVLSAWTAVWLVALGRRLGLGRAAHWAGWMWALYPLAIWNASKTVWDTSAVAFAVTGFALVLSGSGARMAGAVRAGLAFGALLFLNPAPLALAPAALLWLWRATPERAAALRRCAAFTAAAFVVCLPWMLRNQAVLGTFALRPNLGVELRIGNHDEADGHPVPFKYHPSGVPAELELYRELGEVGYARENLERARAWVRANPGRFAGLTLKRVQLFWLGEPPSVDARRAGDVEPAGDWNSWVKFVFYLGSALLALGGLVVMRGVPGARTFLVLSLVLFGLPYYVTHVSERYRFPIDPLLILLDACLLSWLVARRRAGGRDA